MGRILTVVAAAAAVLAGNLAFAGSHQECTVTSAGVECFVAGTSTSVATGWGHTEEPPLRYLRITDGACWSWTRYPPGFDAWDRGADIKIIRAIAALPECEAESTGPGVNEHPTSYVIGRAWEVFRAFTLERPRIRLEPEGGGITGLPTFASAPIPLRIRHHERLPDGTMLEVEAEVRSVSVNWGDGTPTESHRTGEFGPRPTGSALHTFDLKTCPPDYRASHPSGPNCHPNLEEYTVGVGFVWHARFRREGTWTDLGELERWSRLRYDVDEVVGVLG